ncbi:MAG: LysE family translocator [Deltaproteobacteria bacterium]|nr:LysE family translocator [Deltaproteobacteria bacterium]
MFSQLLEFMTIPLLLFAITMCITPGPNNMMLAVSGANFGYRRTLPHILGILVGMNMLFVCAASGLAAVLVALPPVHWILKIGGTAYLLFFSWKIALIRPAEQTTSDTAQSPRPLSFINASVFQFMNPKGLVTGVSTVSVFSVPGSSYNTSVAAIMFTFNIVCVFTTSIWTGVGTIFQQKMKHQRFSRIFNVSVAALTATTVVLILFT